LQLATIDEYPHEPGLNDPERSIVALGQPALMFSDAMRARIPVVLAAGRCARLERYRLCAALALVSSASATRSSNVKPNRASDAAIAAQAPWTHTRVEVSG
jgi:hypothetical protein